MPGQLDLVKAFVDQLRLDTAVGGLARLTTHDASDPAKYRIGRDCPDITGVVPFIGVAVILSHPIMGADVTQIQRALVAINAYSQSEILTNEMLDRVEWLFHAVSTPANTGFYEIPSDVITVRSPRYKGRWGKVEQDAVTRVWSGQCKIDTIWSSQLLTV